ncbi:hypothetical protein H6F71_22115 [Microcoleus sp. FACHB-61]|nr:hypothetical protein [Microcoleus sp. FACHB-61]
MTEEARSHPAQGFEEKTGDCCESTACPLARLAEEDRHLCRDILKTIVSD